jgi:hypothetical protein
MKVYKECCKNCLLSTDRIVSGKRANEIVKDCVKTQKHFICHKASMRNEDICCKKFYDKFGHTSNLIRIAQRLNAVEFVEHTDYSKLPPYNK